MTHQLKLLHLDDKNSIVNAIDLMNRRLCTPGWFALEIVQKFEEQMRLAGLSKCGRCEIWSGDVYPNAHGVKMCRPCLTNELWCKLNEPNS